MAKKKKSDNKAGWAFAGLGLLVAGVAGVGWWRGRGSSTTTPPADTGKVVEDSNYRGFTYRIEEHVTAGDRRYKGVLPPQQVGEVTISQALVGEGALIHEARHFVQAQVDELLVPRMRAVFVGANR